MKLVINSNANYGGPLGLLFESLAASGFNRFEDVVVVVSQSQKDEDPSKKKICEISSCLLENEVTVINFAENNFDYSGYHALHVYFDHPLLNSDGYLYVLDTVTFEADFPKLFNQAILNKNWLLICDGPHSNICAFGKDVVKNYGDNFGTKLTKDEAIKLEWGLNIEGKKIKGISSFGNKIRSKDRIQKESADIYKTGEPRVRFYYPDFHLNKWIFWGRNGDIVGKISINKF